MSNWIPMRVTATLDIVVPTLEGRAEAAREAATLALTRIVDPNRVTPGVVGASVDVVKALTVTRG